MSICHTVCNPTSVGLNTVVKYIYIEMSYFYPQHACPMLTVSSYRFKHIYMFTKSQQAIQFDSPYHSDFQIASVSTK